MLENIESLAKYLTHKNAVDLLKEIYRPDKSDLTEEDMSMRYSEIKEIANTEVTLKRRLDELKEMGLVERETLDEEKFRPTVYRLTQKGEEVVEKLTELDEILE